jgi:hypothetical protein
MSESLVCPSQHALHARTHVIHVYMQTDILGMHHSGGSDMLGTRYLSGESHALEMWREYRTMGQAKFAEEYLWPDSKLGLEQVRTELSASLE